MPRPKRPLPAESDVKDDSEPDRSGLASAWPVFVTALGLLSQDARGQDTPSLFLSEGATPASWLFERAEPGPLGWRLGGRPESTLEIGASLRQQFEGYRNFEFGGEAPGAGWDRYFLHRLLLHADLRLQGRLRLFAQVGNSTIAGNERPAGPVDEDDVYIHQAFVEKRVALRSDDADGLLVRLGRQELSFGSGRLVSLRDGPNIRRSFDAVQVTLRSRKSDVHVFMGAEVALRPGHWDNRVDDDVLLWGVYGEWRGLGAIGNLDLYYFGLDREDAAFDVGTAGESRHSLGARLWGRSGRFDYNIEPVLQVGRFGDRDILAWTLATDTGFRLADGARSPRLGLRANVISGGSSSGQLNTFNALFPNNSYFSEAAALAPANLVDLNPTLTVFPSEDVTLNLMWDHLWRFDEGDGIYVPPGTPAIRGKDSRGRHIGHSISLLAEWEWTERTKPFAAFTHFDAGSAIRSAGGNDVDYFLAGIDWSF